MTRRNGNQLVRKHIWFNQKDWDQIEILFKDKISPSNVIRAIVHDYLQRLEAKTNEQSKPLPTIDNILAAVGGEPELP